jgi:hypothetical protein
LRDQAHAPPWLPQKSAEQVPDMVYGVAWRRWVQHTGRGQSRESSANKAAGRWAASDKISRIRRVGRADRKPQEKALLGNLVLCLRPSEVAWNDKLEISSWFGPWSQIKKLLTHPTFSLVRRALFFADEEPQRGPKKKIKNFFKTR